MQGRRVLFFVGLLVMLCVPAADRGAKDPQAVAVALADVGPTPSPKWLTFAGALRLAGS